MLEVRAMIHPENGLPKAPARAMALMNIEIVLARYARGYQKVR